MIASAAVVTEPTPVTFLDRSITETQNYYAMAGIRNDGSVIAWGDSGAGGVIPAEVASLLDGTIDAVKIYSGFQGFAVIRSDGSVVSWGQCGLIYPAQNPEIAGTIRVKSISSSLNGFAALREDGSVFFWGSVLTQGGPFGGGGGDRDQCSNIGSGIIAGLDGTVPAVSVFISAWSHAATRVDGSVVVWGRLDDSQVVTFPGGLTPTRIFADEAVFVSIMSDGSVARISGAGAPEFVPALDGQIPVSNIASNNFSHAAILSDGSVVAWSHIWADAGGIIPPELQTALSSGVISIAPTVTSFSALKSDGSVVTWGAQDYSVGFPAAMGGVVQLASSYGAFAALDSAGKVYTWGNTNAELGDPNDPNSAAYFLNTKTVKALYSNSIAFAAIATDGTVISWGGDPGWGCCVYKDYFNASFAAVRADITNVTDIINNYGGFVAVKADGSYVTWGLTAQGNLDFPGPPQPQTGIASFANYRTDDLVVLTGTAQADQITIGPSGGVAVGFAGADTITGSSKADSAYGGTGNDMINSGAANDIVLGEDGSDLLNGGPGADILSGGPGSDTASYDGSASGVIVNLATGAASGGDAAGDTLTSIENLQGSSANDTLSGDAAANSLDAGAGSDTVSGGAGSDVLSGDPAVPAAVLAGVLTASPAFAALPGDDVLAGGAGNDSIRGGDGSDTAIYSGPFSDYTVSYDSATQTFTITDRVAGRDGVDTVHGVEFFQFTNGTRSAGSLMVNVVTGTSAADRLTGLAGNNEIYGLGGNDTLTGNTSSDLLDGGTGADKMSGGDGDDTYIVDNASDSVTDGNTANSGNDTVKTTLSSYILPANIENLVYIGSGNFTGTGNGLNNFITGGAGRDVLDGGPGVDVMYGLGGDDSYVIDNGSDLPTEEFNSGIDAVSSPVTVTSLYANVENLTLIGNAALNVTANALNNVVTGNAGPNILAGGVGGDIFIGGPGNDTFYGESNTQPGNDPDTVSFSPSTTPITFSLNVTNAAQVTGGAGSDRLFPASSIENLIGGAGADNLTGSGVANRIDGGAGSDAIAALAGADFVYGNAGSDRIDLGADTDGDIAGYLMMGDSPVGSGRDQISNFKTANDRISLTAIDANTVAAGDQAFLFSGTTPRANSVWYIVSGANILVRGDVNGNTTSDFEILLLSVPSITMGNLAL